METVTFSHFSDVTRAGISFVMSSTTTRVRGNVLCDLVFFSFLVAGRSKKVLVWF